METEDEESRPVREALAYPFAGEGSRIRLLAGAGLNLLAGVLFLGALVAGRTVAETLVLAPVGLLVALVGLLAYVPLAGYGVAIARAVLDGEAAPPAFEPAGVVRDGLWSVGVVLVSALPLVALTALALLGETVVGGGTVGTAVTYGAALAALAYALLAAYALPAAVVNATHEGSPRAALAREPLRETLFDRAYVGPWLAAAAVVLAGAVLGGALAVVVVGFAVLFAAQVAAVDLVTRGVVAARDITISDEPPAPPASGYVPGWSEQQRKRRLSGGDDRLPTTPGASDGDDGGDRAGDDAGGTDRPAAALESGAEGTTAGDDATRTDLAPVGDDDGDDDIERRD